MGLLRGKKIWLHSLGCRTNQSEKESIASGLLDRGALIGDDPRDSDAAVIFTCSVTSVADKKSRQCARMARRGIANGPVIACGCWAQRLGEAEAKELGIDIVVGNRQKHLILGLLESAFAAGAGERMFTSDVWGAQAEWDALPMMRPVTRSRAFVKVQDGCDRFCSYCIVPFLRGRPVSRPLGDVIEEVRNAAASGCGEIVLTGTHLGGYVCELGGISALADEIRRAKLPVRIQFGSIEPFSVDGEFLRAVRGLGARFAPPLHVPLQSGDDGVLSRMRRGYTAAGYLSKIDGIRRTLGEIPISTDLIVGFPGETDEAFQNSVDVVRAVGFSKVHVFPYSPREGTAAAAFTGRVPKDIILKRAGILAEMTKG